MQPYFLGFMCVFISKLFKSDYTYKAINSVADS